MVNIDTYSQRLTNYLASRLEMDDSEKEVVEYGIYMFISETTKLSLTFLILFSLGQLKNGLLIVVVFGLLRSILGGVHAKTHVGCFISYLVSLTIILSAGLLFTKAQCIYFVLASFPFIIMAILRYAPADVENKPIISIRQRKSLRRKGLIAAFVFLVISCILPHPYSGFALFSVILEVIAILPITYKLYQTKYGYIERSY